MKIHLYADDTQLYVPFNPEDSEEAMQRLEACIDDIRGWMNTNFLKLNDSKTEFLILGGKKDLEKVKEDHVRVGDTRILKSTVARNIGGYLDENMDMKDQISQTIRSCYSQMRAIAKIRRYLTLNSAKKIVHAFVTSRLDTLNSLLINLPECHLNKLQLIQNNAARLVMKKMSCHITTVLKDLHWLPVEYRVKYKILLLIFKCLCGKGPVYLSQLLERYVPERDLRSSEDHQLKDARVRKVYGSRAFAIAGPRLWNTLPITMKNCATVSSFKTAVKTHLFKIHFKKNE